MKFLAWFSVIVGTCVASGCSSGTEAQSSDPIGFTFQTDEGSFASFGWTGAVHDVVAPVGTPFGVKVTECTDGVCRFEGPSDLGSNVNRRRCLTRMSKTCNADSDCPLNAGAATQCVYIYDSPLAEPLQGQDGQVGACAWSYIPIAAAGQSSTIRGTLNLTSNALDLENLTVLLALNGRDPTTSMPKRGFYGACTECVGDIHPNDGLKQGKCMLATHLGTGDLADMGLDLGMPCDVNRYGTDKVYSGGYSMDCSPTVASMAPPLSLGGSFTSSGFQVSITDQSPDCSAPGAKCFCGTCPDGRTACTSNADCGGQHCGALSATDCDPNPIPPATGYDPSYQINQCKKFPATDATKFLVAGDECADACNWNAEEGVGTCTSKLRNPLDPTKAIIVGCYPSGSGATIMAPGRADRVEHVGTIYLANTAGASCIPAGLNPALNSQLGLPGLLFQKRNFQIIPEYTENQK